MPDADAPATELYAFHLSQVSRSFAPCIAELAAPLREWVGLAYLLCRVLDTVEDAPWDDAQAQQRQFAALAPLLAAPASADDVADWAKSLPHAVPAGERTLLAHAPRLLADLHGLPPGPRQAVVATLQRMARGMGHFAKRRLEQGSMRLRDLGDVNRYCFVVAGIVGQLLTELLACAEPDFVASPAMARDAMHFGLFLQKVNLLKDQAEDEQAGRFWLPDRAAVRESLATDAHGAARYLLALPRQVPGFRLFCAFSMVLGAVSLPLYGADAPGAKLGRPAALALLGELRDTVADDQRLAEAVHGALHGAFGMRAPAPAPQAAPWRLTAEAWDDWLGALGPTPLSYADAQALSMA